MSDEEREIEQAYLEDKRFDDLPNRGLALPVEEEYDEEKWQRENDAWMEHHERNYYPEELE